MVRRCLPPYSPRANPLARALGDVHDLCTRTQRRKRLRDVVADVVACLHMHGPWRYKLSASYDEAAVTVAVESIATENSLAAAG